MSSPNKKIVLTGGPCAGKTTLTHVIAKVFDKDIVVVPEAASLLFSGGFPRWLEIDAKRAVQRAIYHVQAELEAAFCARHPGKVLVLDRGTVDGAAYWPSGPADFFSAVGTSLTKELNRYSRVLYLESAAKDDYQLNQKKNPNRTESWDEAALLDAETQRLWNQHSRISVIRNQRAFGQKIAEVLSLIEIELRS